VVAATAVSLALYLTMMTLFVRALRASRRRPVRVGSSATTVAFAGASPRVTIFKPLAGCDDDLDENLESFARIDYPSFELLLGVADAADPAYGVARRFVARHPDLDARVVLTDPSATYNPKVAQLVSLEKEATGEVFVISDSNVRVRPTYLWSLVTELEDPRVGVVTSLFSGTGERSLGAALENLQLCGSSAPGLVALNQASKEPFSVGKSMAMRRAYLAQVGGFRPVGDVLAEDYVLGRRFFAAGFTPRMAYEIVENRNVGCTIARTFERHIRWAKVRRSLTPFAFVFEPLMTPIVVATFGVVLAPSKATAALLVAIAALQTAWALGAVRFLRGSWLAWWYAPLEVVRAYLGVFYWAAAWINRRITWRGHAFELDRGSVIVPVPHGAGDAHSPGSSRSPA
jgi:ceramide glucosyltransferase